MSGRERYIAPVGFAREPARERRRWIGRIILAVFVALIVWVLYTRVISQPSDTGGPVPTQSSLPGA